MENQKKKFKDTAIGGFLIKAAPGILDAVGNYFPPAKIIASLIGGDSSMNSADKEKALAMLQQYENERLQIDANDRASARDLQKAALSQDDLMSKRFLYFLAGGSVFIGFVYVFAVTFFTLPEGSQRFADTILGVVISLIFGAIYNFFFGSSDGSKKKDFIQNLK